MKEFIAKKKAIKNIFETENFITNSPFQKKNCQKLSQLPMT
jgi:hypothetical protein